jgi:hypothetical protein
MADNESHGVRMQSLSPFGRQTVMFALGILGSLAILALASPCPAEAPAAAASASAGGAGSPAAQEQHLKQQQQQQQQLQQQREMEAARARIAALERTVADADVARRAALDGERSAQSRTTAASIVEKAHGWLRASERTEDPLTRLLLANAANAVSKTALDVLPAAQGSPAVPLLEQALAASAAAQLSAMRDL